MTDPRTAHHTTADLFTWRPPAAADWVDRLAAAESDLQDLSPEAADKRRSATMALRQLAGMQLDARQQLKLENAARRLSRSSSPPPLLRPMQVALIGNRTLTYLLSPLTAAGLARGLLIGAVEAPYNSLANYAYGPIDPFEGQLDAVVILLDEGAFPGNGDLLDRPAEDQRVAAAIDLIAAAAAAARAKNGCPAIVATLPATAPQVGSADGATIGSQARFTSRVNAEIHEGGLAGRWTVWDLAALAARVGAKRWRDPVRFYSAKTPFRIDLCPLVADHLAALLAALAGKAGRALVLDLDNTLWGGVIGDDGVAGIRLGQNSAEGEAFVAFQAFALDLRRRGVVLAVCSKNDDPVAREPFRTHPEMVLREEHIAVFQANWEDKASNIKTIAETLNLGLESIVFADDNPAERARVRQELPLVSVPELGEDPAMFIERLCESGVFEHPPLTLDDLGRAQAYGGLASKAEMVARLGGYDDYLKSLKMVLSLSPFDEVGRSRITQLINKSNQFNLTTRRYNDEDVRRLQDDPGVFTLQARLDDAFAAQGMIAVVIVHMDAAEWRIDTWLQSCRILGRGVEQTLMNTLVAEARSRGAEAIIGRYVPTDRNGMVADFYDRMGYALVEEAGDGSRTYRLDLAEAAAFETFIEVQRATAS